MRDFLSSENMLPANDRSLLLRLKNARSASRYSSASFRRSCSTFFSFPQGNFVCWAKPPTILVPTQAYHFCSFHADFLDLFLFIFSFAANPPNLTHLFRILWHVTDSRSPPIDPQVSPRFGALEKSPAPAMKRYLFQS